MSESSCTCSTYYGSTYYGSTYYGSTYYGSLECEPDDQARASLVGDHGHGHGVDAAPWPLGA